MNTMDKIITALTPGSIFNKNGLIFRSVVSLSKFAGLSEDEILEILSGEMSNSVTCKPSAGKGVLVALNEHIPVPVMETDPTVQILGGNAVNPTNPAPTWEGQDVEDVEAPPVDGWNTNPAEEIDPAEEIEIAPPTVEVAQEDIGGPG